MGSKFGWQLGGALLVSALVAGTSAGYTIDVLSVPAISFPTTEGAVNTALDSNPASGTFFSDGGLRFESFDDLTLIDGVTIRSGNGADPQFSIQTNTSAGGHENTVWTGGTALMWGTTAARAMFEIAQGTTRFGIALSGHANNATKDIFINQPAGGSTVAGFLSGDPDFAQVNAGRNGFLIITAEAGDDAITSVQIRDQGNGGGGVETALFDHLVIDALAVPEPSALALALLFALPAIRRRASRDRA